MFNFKFILSVLCVFSMCAVLCDVSVLNNCVKQVNEGVREKENSDRLEWIQNHVQCDGAAEVLSLMNKVHYLYFS